jgi:hypothetical protein
MAQFISMVSCLLKYQVAGDHNLAGRGLQLRPKCLAGRGLQPRPKCFLFSNDVKECLQLCYAKYNLYDAEHQGRHSQIEFGNEKRETLPNLKVWIPMLNLMAVTPARGNEEKGCT